jgi:hypothetical protein
MTFGRLSPSTPVYITSGEATPSIEVPQEFLSTPQPTSPIGSNQQFPPSFSQYPAQNSAVVRRWPRMNGMRYLYARGATPQPINRLGQPGGVPPRPYISKFQPNDMGPIRDAGFNDALFQAGYPGFNLGLSFKVPSINTMQVNRSDNVNSPFNSPITVSSTRSVVPYGRTSGSPPRTR